MFYLTVLYVWNTKPQQQITKREGMWGRVDDFAVSFMAKVQKKAGGFQYDITVYCSHVLYHGCRLIMHVIKAVTNFENGMCL